jgi:predicted RND superfamily exporter protein
VVAYESDQVFSRKHLLAIDRISRQIAGLDMVMRVSSLTTVSDFRASEDAKLEHADLIPRTDEDEPDLPKSEEGFAELRKRVLGNRLYVDNIISGDGRATAIAAHIVNDPGDDSYKSRLVKQIKRIAETSGLEEKFYYAGPPVFTSEMERYVSHDLKYFTPVVIVMIGLLLFYVFRAWRSVFLPLLTVIMCLLWTAGFMQLTTGRITIASTILPPLMIAIGVAIVVHVFTQYQGELRINLDRRPALEETIVHVGWPCLLTAITTALGFVSLSASEIPTIIETGLFAAFGVMTAYFIAMAFVPSVLLHMKVEKRPVEQVHPYLIKMLRGIARFNEARPRVVVLITILLVVVSAWGISKLEVETNLINYFSPETEVRKSQEFVSRRLGGSITMDVVIEAGEDKTVADMELLRKVVALEDYLRTLKVSGKQIVGKVFSIADVVLAMNKERMGEERFFDELPFIDEENLMSLKYLRSDTGMLKHLVDANFTRLRVTARLHQVASRDLLKMLSEAEEHLKTAFPPAGGYSATLTGSTRLFVKMGRILVDGEIRGLGMALISIFIVITLLFRNYKMGLIAMVPNVVPIGITLAVMGFAKIPINVTTAMIPCIALGIAVDDTIHYVSRFKREFAEDGHYVNSMFRTLLSTGKPIVFTSLILFCGFMTLAVSSFSCNAYFGILTSITMVSALLGDLIILPVFINIFRPIRTKREPEE